MVSCATGLRAVLIALCLLAPACAAQLADRLGRLSPGARDLLKRTIPAAPRFLAYNDLALGTFPSAAQLSGFTVFALAFLMTTGAADQAQAWSALSAGDRGALVQEYNAAGISLIVSAFGSTDAPTSSGCDPVATADTMAAWVQQYGLQGIDVDYEDFDAFDGDVTTAEPWIISFTQRLRTHLPQGQYILTHAPIAPWFSPGASSGGAYLTVNSSVGFMIDWYNVQFYNQGTAEYTTCDGLLFASSDDFPQSALFQIAASGIPLEKLLIGKPGTMSDADSGYMTAATLATCVAQAVASGWNAGVMVWEYPDVDASWIRAVQASTFSLTR